MSPSFDPRALEKIDSPEATAAAYFSRLRSPQATAEDHLAFDSWYARDEAHRIAWSEVEHSWEKARQAANSPRILAMRERARANGRKRRAWQRPAIAAGLAMLAMLGAVFLYQRDQTGPVTIAADGRTISTGIGQQASFHMTDGSTVTVNTSSTVLVTETEERRTANIRQGEAFFEVAKNERKPFVVQARGVAVTALGTAFAVRDFGNEVRVTLVTGHVRVDLPTGRAAGQSVFLDPGMSLRWREGEVRTEHVDTAQSLGWRQGMLHFDRVPLSAAVAEINRYSSQEIAIVSPGIANHPISGSFRVGVTRGFLQGLEAAGVASVQNETAARVELGAP